MKYVIQILTLLLSTFSLSHAVAQDVASAWKAMPLSIHPTISNTARLDLIDLYQAGMAAQATTIINDTARLEVLGESYMRLRTSRASHLQIKVLHSGRNTLYAVVTTIEGLAANSHIDLYDAQWRPLNTAKYFTAPTLDDFILLPSRAKEERRELHNKITLHTLLYTMSDEDDNIVITPSFLNTLGEEAAREVTPAISPAITMQWKSNKWRKKAAK